MVELYGSQRSRRDLSAHAGALSQFAGVRLVTLGDGVERGVRMLEFRSGTGLRFTVMVDRCLDIGECEYRGMAIGWHSPAGFKHPGLHDVEGEGGLGWLRSASGLLVTCGLDQILFMNEEAGDHYVYGPRKTVNHPLHGRIGMIPAKLNGYGERWDGDDLVLWCEGTVTQGAVFGEHLELVRRIEIKAGTNDIRIHDLVVNRGFYRTPHMYLYHINVGHPVLAEGSRYVAPIRDVVWAGHAGENYRKQGVGYRTMPSPKLGFHEQVWQHEMAADANGAVPVMLVNDALGIGFEVINRKDQFPCNYQWQNLHSGQYTVGLEPSTNHVQGRDFAKERGELIWLEHGDERQYDTVFRVVSGSDEIAAEEARIRAIAEQPMDDYPEPSGKHLAIAGR
ncbi:aldose 1-epimerase family protein [Rhizobium sp. LjRoot254]|uniref:aldose 1-epimerase family protein n=1 Tax=Rhizobium sp. LjRoot254 TaxID=3342297 RepID=UPI003ECF5343